MGICTGKPAEIAALAGTTLVMKKVMSAC